MRRLPALVLVLLVTACGDAPADDGALLTRADLDAAPGAPDGLRSVADPQSVVADDPDPRGPCGAPVPAFPLDGADIVAFERPDVVVVHAVAGAAPGLVDAVVRDLQPGCPSFAKTGPDGDQATELISSLDAGPESVGYVWRMRVGDGSDRYGAHVLLGGRDAPLAGLWVFADDQPDRAFVSALARRAADRLADAP